MYVPSLLLLVILLNSERFKNGVGSKAPLHSFLKTPTTLDRIIAAASGRDIYRIVQVAYEELSKHCLSLFPLSFQLIIGYPWMQVRKTVKFLFLGFLEGLTPRVYLLEC